uniref:Uncharacterized protein n=1 Tax=Rhizophora mucronata TaxID=61149 RepID=A0A2P2J1C8_RHIMU
MLPPPFVSRTPMFGILTLESRYTNLKMAFESLTNVILIAVPSASMVTMS